jgi:hypothetical protein
LDPQPHALLATRTGQAPSRALRARRPRSGRRRPEGHSTLRLAVGCVRHRAGCIDLNAPRKTV